MFAFTLAMRTIARPLFSAPRLFMMETFAQFLITLLYYVLVCVCVSVVVNKRERLADILCVSVDFVSRLIYLLCSQIKCYMSYAGCRLCSNTQIEAYWTDCSVKSLYWLLHNWWSLWAKTCLINFLGVHKFGWWPSSRQFFSKSISFSMVCEGKSECPFYLSLSLLLPLSLAGACMRQPEHYSRVYVYLPKPRPPIIIIGPDNLI